MKKSYFQLLLIAVAGLICYSNTFAVPFQFDDVLNIAENLVIQNLKNFTVNFTGYQYNPRRFIGYLTFALNYKIGALNVAGYHAVNLVIHLLNAFLVYYLASLTLRSRLYAWSKGQRAEGEEQRKSDCMLYAPDTMRSAQLIPLFSALFFVAHPIQTQAVTYIVQRFTSLATMFYLLSVVLYVKGRQIIQQRAMSNEGSAFGVQESNNSHVSRFTSALWFVLSLVAAVLAMRTKEISFTLPIVIVLYEFIFFGSSLRRKLLFLLPLILTLLIIPASMVGVNRPIGDILSDLSEHARVQTNTPRLDYMMTEIRVITTYVRLIFLPVNQNLDYDYPKYHSLLEPSVFFSFLFLSTLFGAAVYLIYMSREHGAKRKAQKRENFVQGPTFEVQSLEKGVQEQNTKEDTGLAVHDSRLTIDDSRFAYYRLIAFGILWFFIALSVESSFIPIADVIFEHRMYLPSAGAFIALACFSFIVMSKLTRLSPRAERLIVRALAAIVVILMAATYVRNGIWQDEELLWQDVVNKSPGNARANNDLGYVLLTRGRPDDAIKYFSSALRLNSNYADAHTNLGTAYYGKGWTDAAIEEFQAALRLSSSNADLAISHHNLGLAYAKRGMLPEAAAEMEAALEYDPKNPEVYSDLGVVYKQKGMTAKAMECYLASLGISPDYAPAHFNLGLLYKEQGAAEKARDYLARAHILDPRNF